MVARHARKTNRNSIEIMQAHWFKLVSMLVLLEIAGSPAKYLACEPMPHFYAYLFVCFSIGICEWLRDAPSHSSRNSIEIVLTSREHIEQHEFNWMFAFWVLNLMRSQTE